jgi:hypothetical protein
MRLAHNHRCGRHLATGNLLMQDNTRDGAYVQFSLDLRYIT